MPRSKHKKKSNKSTKAEKRKAEKERKKRYEESTKPQISTPSVLPKQKKATNNVSKPKTKKITFSSCPSKFRTTSTTRTMCESCEEDYYKTKYK